MIKNQDDVYNLYIDALKNSKNKSEENLILSKIGISDPIRKYDIINYIPLIYRSNNQKLNDKTDFELLELLPEDKRFIANNINKRNQLIEYVKSNLKDNDVNNDLNNFTDYETCLQTSYEKYKKGKLKLCPEGYCTAKEKFDVYPSAYANAYAVQVCKGNKPDFKGNIKKYYDTDEKPKESNLDRWFKEEWVNVCEQDYPPCGRSKKEKDQAEYPYCRPLNKLPGTKVKTVSELTDKDINDLCQLKRSLPQGIEGKPTRIYVSEIQK